MINKNNVAKKCNEIIDWLRAELEHSGCEGFIVGNSGGVDSALTLALCKKATPNVIGVIMPCSNIAADEEHAMILAEKLDIKTIKVDLKDPFESFVKAINVPLSDIAKANIKPRLRASTLYAIGQSKNYLVAGTGNRSEYYLGYFTKWGDGAADLAPLNMLCKQEVYIAATYLGVPKEILQKAPSAGLWDGQSDEIELGVTYEEVDQYLLSGYTNERAARIIHKQHLKTRHKREAIPIYKNI